MDTSTSDNHPAPQASGVGFGALLASAERMGDKTERIYAAEWYLLLQIAERASDLVKGEQWGELREACGGIDNLKAKHAEAVAAYEKWLSDGEG